MRSLLRLLQAVALLLKVGVVGAVLLGRLLTIIDSSLSEVVKFGTRVIKGTLDEDLVFFLSRGYSIILYLVVGSCSGRHSDVVRRIRYGLLRLYLLVCLIYHIVSINLGRYRRARISVINHNVLRIIQGCRGDSVLSCIIELVESGLKQT